MLMAPVEMALLLNEWGAARWPNSETAPNPQRRYDSREG
jgi:hypothetical protein